MLMGQSRHFLAGLFGLAAIVCGCATNRPGNPFAATDGKSATTQAAKTQAGEDRSIADGNNTPRTSSNEKTSLTASPTDAARPRSPAREAASARPSNIDWTEPAPP